MLDEETVTSLHESYKTSLESIGRFEEQLAYWATLELTGAQQAEVTRLHGQTAAYRRIATGVLDLAAELRGKKTIEALLAMDDAEVGLRFLTGEIPLPKPRSK